MIQKYNVKDFKKGWFIGDFKPSIVRTSFEIGYQKHTKGEKINPHYHKRGHEVTLMIRGSQIINGQLFQEGDIFVIEPYTVAEIKILEDTEVIVIKTHSGTYDKVEIK
jgi:hypothetical protein